MNSFRAIIDAFPKGTLADGIDVRSDLVRAWKSRNWIPAEYWNPVVRAATSCGVGNVSLQVMAGIAERRRSRKKANGHDRRR